MKNLKLLTLLILLSGFAFVSCDSDAVNDELIETSEIVTEIPDASSSSARALRYVVSTRDVPNGGCFRRGTGTYFIILNGREREIGFGNAICRRFRAPVNSQSSYFVRD